MGLIRHFSLHRFHSKHGEPEAFRRAAMLEETDECILWPYARSPGGYAVMMINRVPMGVHRINCIEAHGPKPMPEPSLHQPSALAARYPERESGR
jgi:hypothetical protein